MSRRGCAWEVLDEAYLQELASPAQRSFCRGGAGFAAARDTGGTPFFTQSRMRCRRKAALTYVIWLCRQKDRE